VGYDAPARHGPGMNTARTLQAVGDWYGTAVGMALPQGERGAIPSAAILR